MRRLSGALLLLVVACSAASGVTTTDAVVTTTSTTIARSTTAWSTTARSTTARSTTTTRAPALDECPPAPYEIGFLPVNVNEAGFDPSGLEPDVWTSVGGTQTTFYGRQDGTVAIALIRGTLPAVDWPAEKGETEVDGTRAAVGPHPDGTWVAGWYEQPGERCDLYTMVFYAPWSPQEVEAVLLSMNRVGG